MCASDDQWSYQQIGLNVIDWLIGRCRAFTDHTRKRQVKADWSNGKVATTDLLLENHGFTYLWPQVDLPLKSLQRLGSWYTATKWNGLVTSPGGYPGEDSDSCRILLRNPLGGDYLHHNAAHCRSLVTSWKRADRASGDYNQFGTTCNYLHADQVKAEVAHHGS